MNVGPYTDIPVYLIKGKSDKKILITAMIHGDEFTAGLVADKLLAFYKETVPPHSLTIVPKINESGNRELDGEDMNRLFPGGKESQPKRIVQALDELLEEHDALIDLHTAWDSLSFAIVDTSPIFQDIFKWIFNSTNLEVVEEMPEDEQKKQNLDRSFGAWMANHHGKPALTVEMNCVGEGDDQCAQRVFKEIVDLVNGFGKEHSLMPESYKQRFDLEYDVKNRDIKIHVKCGDDIAKGEVIGYDGDKPIKASDSGMLLCKVDRTGNDAYIGMVAKPKS